MNRCEKDNGRLIWQNDFDLSDYGYEEEGIVSVYMCFECETIYEFYMFFDNPEMDYVESYHMEDEE